MDNEIRELDLSKLSIEELRELNSKVVERLKDLFHDKDHKVGKTLKIGDKVSFKGRRGMTLEGIITGSRNGLVFNVEVAGFFGPVVKWKVHASSLTKVKGVQK